jgi:hypothetical protein
LNLTPDLNSKEGLNIFLRTENIREILKSFRNSKIDLAQE